MQGGSSGTVGGSDSGYLCRLGTRLMIVGTLLAVIGGVMLAYVLTSVHEEGYILVGPWISMIVVGAALAVIGFYYRHKHGG
ncbi:MAG: hypothetical protein QG582_1215 [Candidatus Thermoplasmatota archaeon]|nr:hypothetical protein [Candidatus Thermoplasmatota archaeon]